MNIHILILQRHFKNAIHLYVLILDYLKNHGKAQGRTVHREYFHLSNDMHTHTQTHTPAHPYMHRKPPGRFSKDQGCGDLWGRSGCLGGRKSYISLYTLLKSWDYFSKFVNYLKNKI